MLSSPSDSLGLESGPALCKSWCGDQLLLLGAGGLAGMVNCPAHPNPNFIRELRAEGLGVHLGGLPSGQPWEAGLLPQAALTRVCCVWQGRLGPRDFGGDSEPAPEIPPASGWAAGAPHQCCLGHRRPRAPGQWAAERFAALRQLWILQVWA